MLPTPVNELANQANSPTGTPSPDNSVNGNRQNKGTGFTNIGNILNANTGPTGESAGAKIGQSLGNSIAGQANSVQAGIQQSQNQFNSDKNTATNTANNSIQAGSQFARQKGETDDTYNQRLNTGNTDFSAIGKGLGSAAYNGPTSLSNRDQLDSQAANVSALGRLAGTSDGQSQLLRSQVAQKGQYTQGQNSLDSLLLGNSGQQYLQPARSQAAQVASQATNADLNASNQANATKLAVDNNRTTALHNLLNSQNGDGTEASGGTTGLQTSAAKRATDYTNNAQRIQQLLSGKDANGNLIKGSTLGDSDKALLQHLGDYGVSNGSLYADPNDPNAWQSALGNYASNLTTQGLGKELYSDPQRSAAVNLSKLLQDSQGASSIQGQTFNKDIQSDTQAQNSQNSLDSLTGGINSQIDHVKNITNLIPTLTHDVGIFDPNHASQRDAFKNATGLDLFTQIHNGAGGNTGGNNNVNNYLNMILSQNQNQATNLQNQLVNGTTDVQSAALRRLLGQG